MQWSEGRGQRRTAAISRAPATAAAADGRTEIGCPRSCTTFKMPIDQEREGGGGALTLAMVEEGGTGRAMRRAGSGDPSEQRTNPLSSLRPSLRPGRMGFREEGAGANNDDVVNGLIYVFIVVICGLRTSHDEGDEGGGFLRK